MDFLEKLFSASALLCVLLATGCGAVSNHDLARNEISETVGIVGGVGVSDKDRIASGIVGIYNVARRSLCSGSIYANDLIITAAHCVMDQPSNLRVAFGTSLRRNDVIVRKVAKVTVSPLWIASNGNEYDTGDLAILKLKGTIPKNYRPNRVLSSRSLLQNGRVVTLAGYGMSDPANGTGSGLLRKVDALIKDTTFARTEVLIDQTNGRGACHGDSGGPAFVKIGGLMHLWGVTSRGSGTPERDCSQYSVYTNIVAYARWLSRTATELTAPLSTSPLDDLGTIGTLPTHIEIKQEADDPPETDSELELDFEAS